jgi:hypothetical protein
LRTKYATLPPTRGKSHNERAKCNRRLKIPRAPARLHPSLSSAMDTGGTASFTPPYSIPEVVAASAGHRPKP